MALCRIYLNRTYLYYLYHIPGILHTRYMVTGKGWCACLLSPRALPSASHPVFHKKLPPNSSKLPLHHTQVPGNRYQLNTLQMSRHITLLFSSRCYTYCCTHVHRYIPGILSIPGIHENICIYIASMYTPACRSLTPSLQVKTTNAP